MEFQVLFSCKLTLKRDNHNLSDNAEIGSVETGVKSTGLNQSESK